MKSITESSSLYDGLDKMSTTEILSGINKEDQKVALSNLFIPLGTDQAKPMPPPQRNTCSFFVHVYVFNQIEKFPSDTLFNESFE